MRSFFALSITVLIAGCLNSPAGRSANPGGSNPPVGGGPAGMGNLPGCDPSHSTPDGDQDHDGYTPNQGDCNDCNPSINPGAIQIPGDPTDYACNGMPGVVTSCAPMNRSNDPTSLAQAMDQCDPRFFKGAMLVGPSDPKARKVMGSFGMLKPRAGSNMTLLSSGIAADKADPDFNMLSGEDPGTDFGLANTHPHPYPSVMPNPLCASVKSAMKQEPATVNDYTELVLKLKAPTNVNSFSFDFQFFSVEYPVYVCTQFNDEFLVLQESNGEFTKPTNIAFDMQKNPVTVNNGLFTICTNDPGQAYTQHCTQKVDALDGTGFSDIPGGKLSTAIPGGSTGWLTTTSPVTPGEEVTLHFIIFDEGDHILDSAALIDNFRWGTSVVTGPSTNPIQ